MQKGFSLIEVVVTMAVVAMLAGLLIVNFRSSATTRTARHQTALVIISDIRAMQSRALAGTELDGSRVCGFGVNIPDEREYRLFASTASDCLTASRQLEDLLGPGDAVVLETKAILNTNMALSGSFPINIFFELPSARTYLDNSAAPAARAVISVNAQGEVIPKTDIVVSTAGAVDLNDE